MEKNPVVLETRGLSKSFGGKTALENVNLSLYRGKIVGLFFPIMIFVVSGFEHSIANMYYISAGLFGKMNDAFAAAATADTGVLTWGAMFGKNLLPVTIGNIIGGAVCVGLLYWAVYLKDDSKAK